MSPFTSPITFETKVAACLLSAFVILEFTLFMIVVALVALPVVASPAVPLLSTDASPLVAIELSAVAIAELVVVFVALVELVVSGAAVDGATGCVIGLYVPDIVSYCH
jgi:hypothetical protein